MGTVDIKAMSYFREMNVKDFVENVVDLATTLPLFLISADPKNGQVDMTCEPCHGVSVKVYIRSRTNYGKKDPRKLVGADVEVSNSMGSMPPATAALMAKLMADAAGFALLVDSIFAQTAIINPIED